MIIDGKEFRLGECKTIKQLTDVLSLCRLVIFEDKEEEITEIIRRIRKEPEWVKMFEGGDSK